jgi:Ala-tRNA(Pro) deacylase
MNVLENVKAMLDENRISYRAVHHEPTTTSAESAAARGEDLSIGGKAILMKIEEEFKLFVLSAALQIDSKKIKKAFGVKRTRFATAEELMELTGLVPGSVPPFGRPILNLELYLDRSILSNDRIAFNAGSLTDSIIMQTEDYLKLISPQVMDFSRG